MLEQSALRTLVGTCKAIQLQLAQKGFEPCLLIKILDQDRLHQRLLVADLKRTAVGVPRHNMRIATPFCMIDHRIQLLGKGGYPCPWVLAARSSRLLLGRVMTLVSINFTSHGFLFRFYFPLVDTIIIVKRNQIR